MGKYIRLLRLQDQHLQFGCALAAGIYFAGPVGWILLWAVATSLISFAAFITNEMTDREDTDKFSWNEVHLKPEDNLNQIFVILMWWLCAGTGLWLAAQLQVLLWGVLMLAIGTLYSLKPIRFKARFGLDILAQLAVWWWIPFMVPVLHFRAVGGLFWVFVAVMTALIWGIFYPYQLADFTADEKAGLGSTHIRLGMRKSIFFGGALLVLGELAYLGARLWIGQVWSLAFAALGLVALPFYGSWWRMKKRRDQEKVMQSFVGWMKPVSWLLVPYIIWWLR